MHRCARNECQLREAWQKASIVSSKEKVACLMYHPKDLLSANIANYNFIEASYRSRNLHFIPNAMVEHRTNPDPASVI